MHNVVQGFAGCIFGIREDIGKLGVGCIKQR